jgi:hypothetical protein
MRREPRRDHLTGCLCARKHVQCDELGARGGAPRGHHSRNCRNTNLATPGNRDGAGSCGDGRSDVDSGVDTGMRVLVGIAGVRPPRIFHAGCAVNLNIGSDLWLYWCAILGLKQEAVLPAAFVVSHQEFKSFFDGFGVTIRSRRSGAGVINNCRTGRSSGPLRPGPPTSPRLGPRCCSPPYACPPAISRHRRR